MAAQEIENQEKAEKEAAEDEKPTDKAAEKPAEPGK